MDTFGTVSLKKSEIEMNDGEKLKHKREELAIEIRSKHRQNELNELRKLRRQNVPESQAAQPGEQVLGAQANAPGVPAAAQGPKSTMALLSENLKSFIDQVLKKPFTVADFPELQQCLFTTDINRLHFGVIGLRKILSVEDGPPIQMVIDANIVPRLIELMKQDEQPHLQLEAAWALTNIASGTSHQTQTIIDKGGIPLFVKLLSSNHTEIAEQAIWALGNIAGDCSVYRDMILKCGGMDPLIHIVQTTNNRNTIKHGTWTISNLCRGRPLPRFELVQSAIPILGRVMIHSAESEVLTDAAWALSYLSDGDDARIQMVVDTGVITTLIRLLDHPFLSILIPCLRTLGNIVTGNDQQTSSVLDQNALEVIFRLLNHDKRSVRREACWTLSNITAGTAEQIHRVIAKDEWVEKLMQLMETDVPDIKREASWVLSNATSQGSAEDVTRLVQLGVLKKFVDLLDEGDVKTLAVVLEAINNILNKGRDHFVRLGQAQDNPFVPYLESYGAVAKIEELQSHANDDVYKKALKILENHFTLEDYI